MSAVQALIATQRFGLGARLATSRRWRGGTDHGTASCAFLMGGAIEGGRVLADWPGLDRSRLYQGRDLAPTMDLRALAKGVLQGHLGLPPDALARVVFPGSDHIAPL